MIARLNLAINEQSEKFWCGIEDRLSTGEYEKESGRMGEYREFRRVWMVGELGNFRFFKDQLGQVWGNMEEMRNVGEEWGSVLGYGEGVGDVGRSGRRCGRVYGVSVEVVGKWGKECWDVGRCGKMWGGPHTFLRLPYTLHSPPHSPNTSLHTPFIPTHTSPHTFPHLPHSPDTFPTPPPTLSHNPHTSSNTSPYFPYFIIYLIPKFLTFLIYC